MKSRGQVLEIAALREFDVLVIGGGIIGAGVAQDAATRGLSVLLIERDDFSSGTSSRTTKIIDGGLHYLEKLKVNLTKDLCQERAALEQLAPHLIRDFSFILPLTRDDRFFNLKAKIGLTLYDLLSGSIPGIHKHDGLSQKELLEAAPALSANVVAAGLRFHDCVTDDSRLVLEVIKSACNEGANAINYIEAIDFETENGITKVVHCRDRYSGNELSIRGKVVVNATGVWADGLLQKSDPSWKAKNALLKGTHIMVPPLAFETNTALFLPAEDGRYIFVIPWQRAIMIGTTATGFSGDLNNPLPEREEIEYLINCVNRYSGEKKLSRRDVIAAWSGLRSLMNEPFPGTKAGHNGSSDSNGFSGSNGSNASNGSNGKAGRDKSASTQTLEGQIVESADGMISLFGGKLANYRLIASRAVDKITHHIPTDPQAKTKSVSRTKRIMLGGWSDKNDYLTATASIAAKARKLSIEPATLDHLISSYGKDAQSIIDIVEKQPALNERICPDFPPIMAEIPFCILSESAVSLQDLLFRRMRLGMLHQIQCKQAGPKVASLMQSLLNWDDSRATLELAALEKTLDAHMESFRDVAAAVS
jgi:glycerol-3-phosphate dehydrogenase